MAEARRISFALSPEIKKLISRANNDLYSGLSYYNADDEECTMWDEGANRFNLSARKDRGRTDRIADRVYIDTESGSYSYSEPQGEDRRRVVRAEAYIVVEPHDIKKMIVGQELRATYENEQYNSLVCDVTRLIVAEARPELPALHTP
jgi:hypothetical protein